MLEPIMIDLQKLKTENSLLQVHTKRLKISIMKKDPNVDFKKILEG